jgi:hypothetical protein
METKELISWIRRWNPHCEHITLATIFAKMRFERGKCHVINHGPPGSGKSRSSLELLNKLNLGTEIILDNTTTDRGLFETFMNYPEQDIVLDECSTLFRSLKTQDMIKLAMEGKPLTWTKKNESETTPPYQGNLIVNANVPVANTVVDRSLMNRVVMNKEISLSFNDMYVAEYLNGTDFRPFFKQLTNVLKKRKKPLDLNKEEVKLVLKFTQDYIGDLEQQEGYSRRMIIRELSYFRCAKNLFGKLDKEVMDFIKPYAQLYIVNAQTPGLLGSILGNGAMEKAKLVKRLAEDGGWSKQHVRKIINKELVTGKIVLRGKMVSLK